MGENAVGEIPRADDPPVVNNASYQPDFPIWTVFGGKHQRYQPEGEGNVTAEWHLQKIGVDEPPHQPPPPEQFFENRDKDRAADGPQQDKNEILLQCRIEGAPYRPGDCV